MNLSNSQFLPFLTECQRLIWFFSRLRRINIITERDIAHGSDVVQDNTRKYYVACSLWFHSQAVKQSVSSELHLNTQLRILFCNEQC